jgi:hypothetical protein
LLPALGEIGYLLRRRHGVEVPHFAEGHAHIRGLGALRRGALGKRGCRRQPPPARAIRSSSANRSQTAPGRTITRPCTSIAFETHQKKQRWAVAKSAVAFASSCHVMLDWIFRKTRVHILHRIGGARRLSCAAAIRRRGVETGTRTTGSDGIEVRPVLETLLQRPIHLHDQIR